MIDLKKIPDFISFKKKKIKITMIISKQKYDKENISSFYVLNTLFSLW